MSVTIKIPPKITFSYDKEGNPFSCSVQDQSNSRVLVRKEAKERIEKEYNRIFQKQLGILRKNPSLASNHNTQIIYNYLLKNPDQFTTAQKKNPAKKHFFNSKQSCVCF